MDGNSKAPQPEPPERELLRRGWDAIPALIEAAIDPKRNATQRAYALVLLYAITDDNDPFGAKGILGGYERRNDEWLLGKPRNHLLPFRARSSSSDTIDVDAQLKFASRWKNWIEKRFVVAE